MTLQELKQEVYDANLELVKRGLVLYTWGNVSAVDREHKLVVIKPRGIPYEKLEAEDMSVTDLMGRQLDGRLLPSVDLDIHLALYRQFPEIGAIAHTHSTYASAWAQARRAIPAYGTTHGDHYYGEIPCTRPLTNKEVEEDYERYTGDVIVETFLQNNKNPMEVFGVLAAGHGPFTWGKDALEAVENSVILEEIAKMALYTEQINPQAQELEPFVLDKHFFRKHGDTAYFYQQK